MSRRPTIPSGRAFNEAWRALDRDARRRIRRAVNRAQAAGDPGEAVLAVAMARGQQRFWRYGWVFGPLLAVVLLLGEPLPVLLANGAFATVLFGVLAWLFTRRARRAEELNLEAAKAKPQRRGGRRKPGRGRRA